MNCPYCAEEIKDEALACRYCGRDLVLFKPMLQKISSLEEQVTELSTAIDDLAKRHSRAAAMSSFTLNQHLAFWHRVVAMLLPALLISASSTLENLIVVLLMHSSVLLFGFWVGIGLPGKHIRDYFLLGSAAGVLGGIGALQFQNFTLQGLDYPLLTTLLFLAIEVFAATTLFVAGGLFADLLEGRRDPDLYYKPQLVRRVGRKLAGAGREPSQLTIALIQATVPASLGLVGTVVSGILAYLATR